MRPCCCNIQSTILDVDLLKSFWQVSCRTSATSSIGLPSSAAFFCTWDKVFAIRDIPAMLRFPSVILRQHACDPRPFFCSSGLLSLNDRNFIFHLRAFRVRCSAVFECDLRLTHRLLAGHISVSSMLSSTHRFFIAD
jgi:hypothetical protein